MKGGEKKNAIFKKGARRGRGGPRCFYLREKERGKEESLSYQPQPKKERIKTEYVPFSPSEGNPKNSKESSFKSHLRKKGGAHPQNQMERKRPSSAFFGAKKGKSCRRFDTSGISQEKRPKKIKDRMPLRGKKEDVGRLEKSAMQKKEKRIHSRDRRGN